MEKEQKHCEEFEKLLLDAAKQTLIDCNRELNMEEYKKFIGEVLLWFISNENSQNQQYGEDGIYKFFNWRDAVKSKFQNYCQLYGYDFSTFLEERLRDNDVELVAVDSFTKENLPEYIKVYVDRILRISDDYFKNDQSNIFETQVVSDNLNQQGNNLDVEDLFSPRRGRK